MGADFSGNHSLCRRNLRRGRSLPRPESHHLLSSGASYLAGLPNNSRVGVSDIRAQSAFAQGPLVILRGGEDMRKDGEFSHKATVTPQLNAVSKPLVSVAITAFNSAKWL